MDEDEENEEQRGGDNASTPVEELPQPSPTAREEPPQPIGPTLNKAQIVIDSLDIISNYLKTINYQKHYLASMAFMTHSMQKLLDLSREHQGRLNRFLLNDDKLQNQWFLAYHQILPPYREYTLVLKDVPDLVSVDGIPNPVEQKVLKELAEDVHHNLYASGWQVKAQRHLDLGLNSKMEILREETDMDEFPFTIWLMLLAKEIGHEETLENKFFEVSSFLDFLNHSTSS